MPTQIEQVREPKAQPDEPAPAVAENHGVDLSKIGPSRCMMNGREVTMEHALGVVGGQIPDDSQKLRLTVIGTQEKRQPVITALAQLEPELRNRIVPWSVPADHWSLKDTATGQTAFKADGAPTVYLQAPDGKVLHRQDDWRGPDDFQAIRKAVKAYDAKKDPDLRKADQAASSTSTFPLWLIAIAGAVVFFLVARRNPNEPGPPS
jgi:hypothetical protein